jgi:hypothetical protein
LIEHKDKVYKVNVVFLRFNQDTPHFEVNICRVISIEPKQYYKLFKNKYNKKPGPAIACAGPGIKTILF